ncbi:MAG TPA: hypothetical protein EYO33_12265 [Phycisphaerales bacterium]|nr:hypothetical protein [Phycisphaerales bacterium]
MMVEYRLKSSTRARFYFITLTYKAGKNLQRDASFVAQSWRRLLWWLKSEYPPVQWIRVVELTKQMQPHLHVILSFGLGNDRQARCEQKARYDARWLAKKCSCLEHAFSAAWRKITGDSYVVDVRAVQDGDATYLSKYVAKSFLHDSAFRDLGFHRAWSRSRSWNIQRLQLKTTAERGWKRVEFTPGKSVAVGAIRYGSWEYWVKKGETSHLRARVGTELARELAVMNEDRASKNKVLGALEVLRAGS